MESRHRSSLVGGLVLIVLGVLFLAFQLSPSLRERFRPELSWPLIVVGVGLLLLVIGLATGAPGMALPACIVGGIGGLLYWQNATDNWDSWAYAWALIPGFVGVGTILSGLLGNQPRRSLEGGAWLVMISLMLFLIFGSFLGGLNLLGPYWPVLLIVAGLLYLVRSLIRSYR
jgi:hypothetical protein